MADIHGAEVLEKDGEEREVETKRSLRNKGKEDQKIEEMAKIRAEERDNYGKDSVFEFANPSLLQISSMVGIDLGCSVDMIAKNVDIINKMERARREIYFQSVKRENIDEVGETKREMEEGSDTPVYINTGDMNVDELCSDLEHSDADIEEQQYKNLKGFFSGRKGARKSSPALSCVKQSVGIGVLRRKKGKKTD